MASEWCARALWERSTPFSTNYPKLSQSSDKRSFRLVNKSGLILRSGWTGSKIGLTRWKCAAQLKREY